MLYHLLLEMLPLLTAPACLCWEGGVDVESGVIICDDETRFRPGF